MTNVSATVERIATRRGLFALAEKALIAEGWTIHRVARGGKASLREIRRGDVTARVSIRTSQDTWIAFPPKSGGNGWVTLDDVDYVIAASVNDQLNPTEARVHMVPGDEVRDRFNRAYAARKAAGYTLPEGRGVWVSLYEKEANDPVTLVGAGMGLVHKPLITCNLTHLLLQSEGTDGDVADEAEDVSLPAISTTSVPITIAEAKRQLAASLGVPESAIRITIEH